MVVRDQRAQDFDQFVSVRSAALLRTAYLITGQRQSAEDLLQTALAKTYLATRHGGGPESLEAYVRRVMVTTHISWWRRRKGREEVLEEPPEPTGASDVDLVAERDELWRALARLSERQRTVLVLRYYEDLSEEEIAALMGCSRGSVKTHASRGIATLRTMVGFDEETSPPSALDPIGGSS